jgi:hypothetical protein
MRFAIVFAWNFIFDHETSPLRHIPDVGVRHMILQILGWMWAFAFTVAVGSYTWLPASLIGHAALIAASAVTVGTCGAASLFARVRSVSMAKVCRTLTASFPFA